MGGSDYSVLIPYFVAALFIAMLAIFRAWGIFDRTVDRTLAAALVLLGAVVAATHDLGTDASGYHEYYNGLTTAAQHYVWWDPGFESAGLVFARLGAPYGVFVAACFCASYAIKLLIYDKFLTNLLLALFLLFCLNIGEVAFVREYLAASLVLLMYYLLMKGKPLQAVVVLILAISIHKSALLAGLVVVLVAYGYRSLYPAAISAGVAYLVYLLLPASVLFAAESRLLAQVADYTAQGFIQGMGNEQVSLFRNVAKFGLYIVVALWMITLPVADDRQLIQRRASYVVLALSFASVALIAVSPVFSRLSAYVFVFIPLCLRAERFRPLTWQLAAQTIAMGLFLVYFAAALFPLVDYL